MKMYVKPSIEVIELQLKEDIAAVPTTVYKGKKGNLNRTTPDEGLPLSNTNSGLTTKVWNEYGISIL